jgi:hypothetical protein
VNSVDRSAEQCNRKKGQYVSDNDELIAAANAVIDRLREGLGCSSDAALQRALGVAGGAVRNWRVRGTVPCSHCVDAANAHGLSLDWLLLGRGPRRAGAMVAEPPPVAYQAQGPPMAAPTVEDERLAALVAWLEAVWVGATEEERAWLVVELRMLRGRLREGG